ncbi:transposase [Clostridium sp. CF011]|uniref:transposase n=1 Tax=Clostridium sp. CF011 TaxID=2843318 RepID=UPI001C0BA1D8|nr:transposase [Clostridium sp. CF011]MBU3093423.1 transposase [Clostridium sp. CF011]WAG71268.1 transposase [Clostridium sp. CF011]
MGRKSTISDQQKIKAVTSYLNGKASMLSLCNKLQVHKSSFQKWVIRYKSEGEAGLKHSSKNTSYTAKAKINIVKEYLDGHGSLNDLCIKYHISSNTVLCNWIKKYNGHENIKSSGTGGKIIMTKGRKTSYIERIEIIKYCIENNSSRGQFSLEIPFTIFYFYIPFQNIFISFTLTTISKCQAPYIVLM